MVVWWVGATWSEEMQVYVCLGSKGVNVKGQTKFQLAQTRLKLSENKPGIDENKPI